MTNKDPVLTSNEFHTIDDEIRAILSSDHENKNEQLEELLHTINAKVNEEEKGFKSLQTDFQSLEKDEKEIKRKESSLKRRQRKLKDAIEHRKKLSVKPMLPYYQMAKIDHVCGMQNLGNTCFMNSALQCFMKSEKLKNYVLTNVHQKDINLTNKLGTKGDVIKAFAEVVQGSSNQMFNHISPRFFKYIVGKYRDQFLEFYQQDVAELITFLLDSMHEDTNRIETKPPFKPVEIETDDHVKLSQAYYDALQERDSSYINDLFQGQERAILQCKECHYKTVSFSPFYTISLPVPIPVKLKKYQIIFVPHSLNETIQKYALFVDVNGTAIEFKQRLAAIVNKEREIERKLKPSHIVLANVSESDVHQFIPNLHVVRKVGQRIYAYELPQLSKKTHPKSYVKKDVKTKTLPFAKVLFQTNHYNFYTPFLIHFEHGKSTNHDIYVQVARFLERFRIPSLDDSQSVYEEQGHVIFNDVPNDSTDSESISSSTSSEPSSEPSSGSSYDNLQESHKESFKEFSTVETRRFSIFQYSYPSKRLLQDTNELFLSQEIEEMSYPEVDGKRMHAPVESFTIDISSHFTSYFNVDNLRQLHWKSILCHESVEATLNQDADEKPKSLQECLSMYTNVETLGEDNLWYCPSCKTHVSALKKVDLWRTPDYLVFQLNRFQFQGYERQKLTHQIDFPVDHLDLSSIIANPKNPGNSYKLFAISNHYGVLSAGHYTAFARDHQQSDKWYRFDDMDVTPIQDVSSELVTPAAYVLFYARV